MPGPRVNDGNVPAYLHAKSDMIMMESLPYYFMIQNSREGMCYLIFFFFFAHSIAKVTPICSYNSLNLSSFELIDGASNRFYIHIWRMNSPPYSLTTWNINQINDIR